MTATEYGNRQEQNGLPLQFGTWQRYWIGLIRVLVGWWFLESGLRQSVTLFNAEGWLTTGTANAPFWVRGVFLWIADSPELLALVNLGIPLVEAMIGLALIIGLLTKLAAFGGASLMFFFYFGNAGWQTGFVNADLMGLLLFLTLIVFNAGRVWSLDRYIENTAFVESHPRLRYILG